ncbi:MAG: stage III sporulation protein AA [Eubacteriales bacterium]|nr:stage III sporulation protein AA [Eubacteriales bacterium]
MQLQEEIIRLFPEHLRFKWKYAAGTGNELQEIRLRAQRPIMVYLRSGEWYLEESGRLTKDEEAARCLPKEELGQILKHICRYSLYAYEEEMSKGYISADGGFRVGIAGEVILNPDGSVKNVRYISSLNIRIAHEIKGAAAAVMPWLYEEGKLQNTLIISPPGCGKTTLLRDAIRLISDGNELARGRTVGLVDERSEIAGCFQGIPGNDVGRRTDVLDGCPKAEGMMMLLRSMAPEVVAVDELGSEADVHALEQVLKCGCSVMATIHGACWEEACRKRFLKPLFESRTFGRFLILEKRDGNFWVEQVRNGTGEILTGHLPC